MRIGLGTAQFGMNYGITNNLGRMTQVEVDQILDLALAHNIKDIDTAPAYRHSQALIGRYRQANKLTITTKTIKMAGTYLDEKQIQHILRGFEKSLISLNTPSCHALLLHDIADIKKPGFGKLVKALEALRKDGIVKKIGISAYTLDDVKIATDVFDFDIIQIPINIFNQGFASSDRIARLRNNGVEIHGRSIFLQGILLTTPSKIPAELQPLSKKLLNIYNVAHQLDTSPLHISLDYVQRTKIIDVAILGVCSVQQLEQIIDASGKTLPAVDYSHLAVKEQKLIDPRFWK